MNSRPVTETLRAASCLPVQQAGTTRRRFQRISRQTNACSRFERKRQCGTTWMDPDPTWDNSDETGDEYDIKIYLTRDRWIRLCCSPHGKVIASLREDVWIGAGVRESLILAKRAFPDLQTALVTLAESDGLTPAAFIEQARQTGDLDDANYIALLTVLTTPRRS